MSKKYMKTIHIEMHEDLFKAYCCMGIEHEAADAGTRVDIVNEICDPSLIQFTRTEDPFSSDSGQTRLVTSRVPCKHALCIKSQDEISELFYSKTLTEYIQELSKVSGKVITLVMFAVKGDHLGKLTSKRNRTNPTMSEVEIHMAMTDLLLFADCDWVTVKSRSELSEFVLQITKAAAEEPLKKVRREVDEQADFYMRGDNKQCVAIDKKGNGVDKLWQQVIAVLPSSSLETSRAICAKYKTPKKLYEALQLPNTVNKIADIGVARTAVPGAKLRRVGPEFARKLKILFTAEDGRVVIE